MTIRADFGAKIIPSEIKKKIEKLTYFQVFGSKKSHWE